MQASRTTKNLSLPKRVLACLMSAALCMAFAPAVAWGDWDPPLLTITGDESGYTIFTFDFYFQPSIVKIIKDGDYTISGSTEFEHIRVEPGVTANITLDNAAINVSDFDYTCAFKISPGATVNLTLQGENKLLSGWGMASLQVEALQDQPAGTLVITEASTGSLQAIPGSGAAGIGGGRGDVGHTGGNITINGGTITVENDYYGAGIGGGAGDAGDGGDGGNIIINGGTVTASGRHGAGIGGGLGTEYGGSGGNVTITGGTVTAHSVWAAGIGSGLGSGYYKDDPTYTRGSGTFSTTETGSAVITATSDEYVSIADTSGEGNWSGIFYRGKEAWLYGPNIAPVADFTVAAGYKLTVKDYQTLTIPKGVTLNNKGTIMLDGGLVNQGNVVNESVIINNNAADNSELFVEFGTQDTRGVIGKGMLVKKPKAVEDLVYNGSPQALVSSNPLAVGYIEYSLDGESWSTECPRATEAGLYTVYYRAVDGSGKVISSEHSLTNEIYRSGAIVQQVSKALANKKAVERVKNKAFSVKAGATKSISFKTHASSVGTRVTYNKVSGSKYITVSKNGKVTAKKGLKKGKEYIAKVKVTCGKATNKVEVTVRVK